MAADEIRVALCEWLGYRCKADATGKWHLWLTPEGVPCCPHTLMHPSREAAAHALPTLTLDFMAAVEKKMDATQYQIYANALFVSAKVHGATGRWVADDQRKYLSATSPQRAEAAARTLWPERFKQ